MNNKKVIGILLGVILLVAILVAVVFHVKDGIDEKFLKNINGEEYVVSGFENKDGIVRANFTGDLSEESIRLIVSEIYIKAQDDNVKEKEIKLNIFKDGENKEFKENTKEDLYFNVDINLQRGTYTLKSVNEFDNIQAGYELGKATNNKLISVKDNNLEIGIDMKLDEFSKEEALQLILNKKDKEYS